METFKALRIFSENDKVSGRVVETRLDELSAGEVVFKTAFSSVNYKDALAATGAVESSFDPRFNPGEEVICTSYEFGVSHDGGFAQYCRVPADWVVPLPGGLTLHEAATLGVAGYTRSEERRVGKE